MLSAFVHAESPEVSYYIGAGSTQRQLDEQTGNGDLLYMGFSLSDKQERIVSRIELQLEQFSLSVVEADQVGLHFQGSLFANKNHQLFLDAGANYAEYSIGNLTAEKGFISAGLGYLFSVGPFSMRISYEVEHIGEVEGIDIGNVERATASASWAF